MMDFYLRAMMAPCIPASNVVYRCK